MKLRCQILATTVTLLASLAVAGPASAEPADGASVTESSGCREIYDGVICHESRWVEQRHRTPSGVYSGTAIGDTTFTYTGADGCTWTRSMKKREHVTFRSGPQQGHVLQITDSFNTCFGESIQCTTNLHFVYAGGEGRLRVVETECTPVEST